MPQGVSARIAVIVASTLLTFAADVFTPLGIAVWILYVIPVRLAATIPWWKQSACYAMASLCIVLLAVGGALSPSGITPWVAALNRTLGAVLLFGAAAVFRRSQRRQHELAQSRELLRQLVDVLDLANVLVRDLDDRVTLWNTGMEQLYGYKKSEALGRISHDLLKTRFPVSLSETRTALLRDSHWSGEVVHTRKDGADIAVVSTWQLHRDPSGRPHAILETSTDITLQKTAERSLRDLAGSLEEQVRDRTQQLEDANDQLEAFAYTVAHDLRAPLRAVQGFSQALLEDYAEKLDEGGRGYLRRNVKAAQDLDGLIQDLLAYSRLGRADLRISPVSLEGVLSDVLQSLNGTVQERKASISVKGPMPNVLAHSSTLNQAIQNLMTNALKFTPKGQRARVEVKAEDRGDRVRLWVQDYGIGIAPEHHGRIFRVFERLHGTEAYPGTGIGLSIVEKALERMHGNVGLESVPGQGSRFWIELQKVGSAPPPAKNLGQEV
jgi:PAS domain S-box-containing protein